MRALRFELRTSTLSGIAGAEVPAPTAQHRIELVLVMVASVPMAWAAYRLAHFIRQHWSIENQLHWVLDVTFTEDASRIRRQHAPQTSAMLRRLAVSILSADTSLRDTLRGKRYRACLSTDSLEGILRSFVEK
jgi:hypothetical protein